METIKQNHLHSPLRPVQMIVRSGCSMSSGTLTIAIPGSGQFDLTQVDASSLTLHGLRPKTTIINEIANELTATFDTAQFHLPPHSVELRLTGWLKNGQRFVAVANYNCN